MHFINSLLNKLRSHIIHIGLGFVLILLFLYLFCDRLRFFLYAHNIDPNFIIGFSTIIALLLSLIQSSRDKKYTYNLKLIESIEDKGLRVIGKLLIIQNKSSAILGSLIMCKEALDNGAIYKDCTNTISSDDVDKDIELIVAYVDTYFPDQSFRWNNLIDKLNKIGTINGNVVLNYSENIKLIEKKIPFTNDVLDNIEESIREAKLINEEINVLSLNIREVIVSKINDSKGKLKNTFDFKL